jgi:hypothetical protein
MENTKQGSQFPSKEAGNKPQQQQQQGGKSSGGQFPGAGGAGGAGGRSSEQQTKNQPGSGQKQEWQKSGQKQT